MPKTTMKDIAKKAGVSQPLVSLIMNNNTKLKVSDKSREKVLRIARELNYTPDQAARSLKTGRKNVIGITGTREVPVTEVFASPYFAEIYAGVGEVVTAGGYRMLFAQHRDEHDASDPLALAQGNMVDGLVIILLAGSKDEFETAQLPRLKSLGIPFTVIHSFADLEGCVSVGIDQERGAHDAVRHLVEHGYTDIGMAYTDDPSPLYRMHMQGYCRALEGAGLPVREERLYRCGSMYVDGGLELAERLVSGKGSLPRAVYCTNNGIASGLLAGFRRAGIAVPEQAAVIACGDIPCPGATVNELSMYHHPAKAKGEYAARRLLGMIDDPGNAGEEGAVVLDMPFVKGNTCGC